MTHAPVPGPIGSSGCYHVTRCGRSLDQETHEDGPNPPPPAAILGTIRTLRERVRELRAELEDAEASARLQADLNRRAAQVLGKPTEGEGSSWHDIPERIEALRAVAVRLAGALWAEHVPSYVMLELLAEARALGLLSPGEEGK